MKTAKLVFDIALYSITVPMVIAGTYFIGQDVVNWFRQWRQTRGKRCSGT